MRGQSRRTNLRMMRNSPFMVVSRKRAYLIRPRKFILDWSARTGAILRFPRWHDNGGAFARRLIGVIESAPASHSLTCDIWLGNDFAEAAFRRLPADNAFAKTNAGLWNDESRRRKD